MHMKKTIMNTIAFTVVLFFAALIAIPVSAQPAQKTSDIQKPIPADVMKLLGKSCVTCHSDQGGKMAMSVLNITSWEKYSSKKQAAKANSMCKMVTKDKMPPKSFREGNPDAVLTQEDIKLLCDWARSLKPAKK
jgi:hypothetical protein